MSSRAVLARSPRFSGASCRLSEPARLEAVDTPRPGGDLDHDGMMVSMLLPVSFLVRRRTVSSSRPAQLVGALSLDLRANLGALLAQRLGQANDIARKVVPRIGLHLGAEGCAAGDQQRDGEKSANGSEHASTLVLVAANWPEFGHAGRVRW